MIRRKKLKRISDLKEEISKRYYQSFWESRKCLFCGVADDVSKLCADGTQDAASKKINKEKNRAFSDNLW